jgi:hypothetical protein
MSIGLNVIRQSLVAARLGGTVFGFTIVVLREFGKFLLESARSPSLNSSPISENAPLPGTAVPAGVAMAQAAKPNAGILVQADLALEAAVGSSAFCSFIKGGCTVDMRLYVGANPRIESVMKVPCERLHWMRAKNAFERVKLDAYTAQIAAAAGLPYTFQGAQKFILKSPAATVSSVPAQANRITNPFDSVASTPATRFESDDADTIEITGTVVSAGNAVVRPARGNSYTTFTVVVMTSTGDVSLSGIDLKDKFELRKYGIGDLVCIKKARAEFSVEDKGVEKKRSKNTYQVTVLQKATT